MKNLFVAFLLLLSGFISRAALPVNLGSRIDYWTNTGPELRLYASNRLVLTIVRGSRLAIFADDVAFLDTVTALRYVDPVLRGVNSKTIIEAADGVDVARFGFSDYSVQFPQIGEGPLYVDADGNLLPLDLSGLTYSGGVLTVRPLSMWSNGVPITVSATNFNFVGFDLVTNVNGSVSIGMPSDLPFIVDSYVHTTNGVVKAQLTVTNEPADSTRFWLDNSAGESSYFVFATNGNQTIRFNHPAGGRRLFLEDVVGGGYLWYYNGIGNGAMFFPRVTNVFPNTPLVTIAPPFVAGLDANGRLVKSAFGAFGFAESGDLKSMVNTDSNLVKSISGNVIDEGTNIVIGGVTDATLVTTSNAILALAPVTFETIADMIAGFTTNLCYVKAHHGMNGLGGGFFELRHTNGFATNELTIFATPIPKKFAFRLDPSPLNPEWAGAVPNDGIDDSVPVQKALNLVTNGSGVVKIPIGNFTITNTLGVTNITPGYGFMMEGEQPYTRGPTGSELTWAGAAGGTIFRGVGLNSTTFKNISFNAASIAKYAVQLDSINVGTPSMPGSSGIQFEGCGFLSVVGAGSAGLVLAHAGASGEQVSEVRLRNCNFQGTAGSDHAFQNLVGANVKQFVFDTVIYDSFTNAFNINSGSSLVHFQNINGGNTKTAIVARTSRLLAEVWYCENDNYFLHLLSDGANAASAYINTLEWAGTTLASANDVFIYSQGSLIIENSLLKTARADVTPKILMAYEVVPNNSARSCSIISRGNYYRYASVQPFYGDFAGDLLGGASTNNWLLHTNTSGAFDNTNAFVVSEGDLGGVEGALVPLLPHHLGGGNYNMDHLNVLGTLWANLGRVGILTNAPAFPLDVRGVIHGSKFQAGELSSANGSYNVPIGQGLYTKNAAGDNEYALIYGDGEDIIRLDRVVRPLGIRIPTLTALRPVVINSSGDFTNAIGTPDGTKFLRDDGTLAVPAGGSAIVDPITNRYGAGLTFTNLGALRQEGAATFLTTVLGTSFRAGASSSSAGSYNVVIGQGLYTRNAAGDNDTRLISADGDDVVNIGTSLLRVRLPGAGNFSGGNLTDWNGNPYLTNYTGGAIVPFIRIPDDGSSGSTNFSILTDTNLMYDASSGRPTFRFTNLRNGARAVLVVTNGSTTGLSVSNVGTTNNIVWENEVPRADWDGVSVDAIGTYIIRLHCTASNIIGRYDPPFVHTGNGAGVSSNAPTLYNSTLLGTTAFDVLSVGSIVETSNTVEFAGSGITFKAINPNLGRRWVNTNAPNGNIVADWQNLHKQTNNHVEAVWNSENAGGADRYVTNTFSSVIGSVPTVFSVNGATTASTFTLRLTNGFWTECSAKVVFHKGTNHVRVITVNGAL